MAKNTRYDSDSTHRTLATGATTYKSGEAFLFGKLPCVALRDSANGLTVVDTAGVYKFKVSTPKAKAEPGDIAYMKETNKVTNNSEGASQYGYILGAIEKEKEVEVEVHIGF